MRTYLFIGGPADGKRMAVEYPRVAIPVKEIGQGVKQARYEKTRLWGDEQWFEVFVLEGMKGDELVSRLLAGYKKNRDQSGS
jgi:hypothetical protein